MREALLAEYLLACGHAEALPVTRDMLLTDRSNVSGTVMCGACGEWCGVIERLDPADEVAS
ncbi:hypothetical protein ACXIZN_24795 [Amycolatopsis sp. TRM77291]